MRFRYCRLALVALLLLSQPVRAETTLARESSATAAAAHQTTAVAEPGSVALSLEQAIARFRSENLKIVAARYEVGLARADIIAAGLLPNPRLSLDAEFRVHGEPDGAERQYSIQLAQTLPLWGRLAASKEAARLTADAAEREFAAAVFQLLGELRLSYLALQLVSARHAVLSAGLADLERVRQVLEARAAAGANPEYDRLRLDLERGNLRARVAQAAIEISEARAQLAAAIGGAPLGQTLTAEDSLAEPLLEPREAALLVRRALERRPEVGASRLETSAAEARLRAIRRRFIPEPEIGLGYARWSGVPGAGSRSFGGALLASAAIPLPLFDRGQGTIERRLEESRAARVRERDVKNGIARQVERAAQTLRLTGAAYLTYRETSSRNAESVRRIAELTYREGRGTILELLDAYSSYLRVEEQVLELRGAALSAALELEQAIGP